MVKMISPLEQKEREVPVSMTLIIILISELTSPQSLLAPTMVFKSLDDHC
jgi:hypothetical protein